MLAGPAEAGGRSSWSSPGRRPRTATRPWRGRWRVPRRSATCGAARLGARLPARGPLAGAGRGDAPPRGGDQPRAQRRAPAAPPRRRRDPPPRGDAQRDARPDRALARARAGLRRRRQPRAAHAAHGPPRRARAGGASGPHQGGAGGGRGLGDRRGRPPRPACGGPAGDRALRRRPAADQARSRSTVAPLLERVAQARGAGREAEAGARRAAPIPACRPNSTRFASSRRSATSSATRSSTARARSGSRREAQGADARRSRSPTRAAAFPRASRAVPSSASAAPSRAHRRRSRTRPGDRAGDRRGPRWDGGDLDRRRTGGAGADQLPLPADVG